MKNTARLRGSFLEALSKTEFMSPPWNQLQRHSSAANMQLKHDEKRKCGQTNSVFFFVCPVFFLCSYSTSCMFAVLDIPENISSCKHKNKKIVTRFITLQEIKFALRTKLFIRDKTEMVIKIVKDNKNNFLSSVRAGTMSSFNLGSRGRWCVLNI